MIKTVEEAKNFRAKIEGAAQKLDDSDASLAVELFQGFKYDGSLISAGTRINWNGTLKRAAVDLWGREEDNPDNAPELWEDIAYRDGYRIIPETITAGTAFVNGDKGWWGDKLYVSLIDANVWTPLVYPQGWAEVER